MMKQDSSSTSEEESTSKTKALPTRSKDATSTDVRSPKSNLGKPKDDSLNHSAAVGDHVSSAPVFHGDSSFGSNMDDVIDGETALELRRRNAVYSKRKYYKKKMEVQRLDTAKSELCVANEKLKSENLILERALQEAQSKVLVVESMRSILGQPLLSQTLNLSLPQPQFNAPSAFPAPFAPSPATAQPDLSRFLELLSAVTSGSGTAVSTATAAPTSGNAPLYSPPSAATVPQQSYNATAAYPSSAAIPVATTEPAAASGLDERIQAVRDELLKARGEEQQLLQLLGRLGGSMPPPAQPPMIPAQPPHVAPPLPPVVAAMPAPAPAPLAPHQLLQEHQRILQEEQNLRAYQQQLDQQKQGLLQQQQRLLEQYNPPPAEPPTHQNQALQQFLWSQQNGSPSASSEPAKST